MDTQNGNTTGTKRPRSDSDDLDDISTIRRLACTPTNGRPCERGCTQFTCILNGQVSQVRSLSY